MLVQDSNFDDPYEQLVFSVNYTEEIEKCGKLAFDQVGFVKGNDYWGKKGPYPKQ